MKVIKKGGIVTKNYFEERNIYKERFLVAFAFCLIILFIIYYYIYSQEKNFLNNYDYSTIVQYNGLITNVEKAIKLDSTYRGHLELEEYYNDVIHLDNGNTIKMYHGEEANFDVIGKRVVVYSNKDGKNFHYTEVEVAKDDFELDNIAVIFFISSMMVIATVLCLLKIFEK